MSALAIGGLSLRWTLGRRGNAADAQVAAGRKADYQNSQLHAVAHAAARPWS
jgi:hypothetical protein